MKKIDKKQVMIRAWEIKRNTDLNFAQCLKRAWDEAKFSSIDFISLVNYAPATRLNKKNLAYQARKEVGYAKELCWEGAI
ncbi:MAG: hypothetical protein FWC41_00470 [Firmicutes bacterium]|nr:hypothetical protein [Bacillota bacterium]